MQIGVWQSLNEYSRTAAYKKMLMCWILDIFRNQSDLCLKGSVRDLRKIILDIHYGTLDKYERVYAQYLLMRFPDGETFKF